SSAVGMFEPVTMTRSAVAVAAAGAGKTFPCASRVGAGDVVCAGRFQTMAKKIASRTETVRSNPHPRSWIFFIQVRLSREEYKKRLTTFNSFFSLFFIFGDMFIIARTALRVRAALKCGFSKSVFAYRFPPRS